MSKSTRARSINRPSPKGGGADSPHPVSWSSWRDNALRFDEAVEMVLVSLPRIPEEEALAKTRET
jgi:hypothetical protein